MGKPFSQKLHDENDSLTKVWTKDLLVSFGDFYKFETNSDEKKHKGFVKNAWDTSVVFRDSNCESEKRIWLEAERKKEAWKDGYNFKYNTLHIPWRKRSKKYKYVDYFLVFSNDGRGVFVIPKYYFWKGRKINKYCRDTRKMDDFVELTLNDIYHIILKDNEWTIKSHGRHSHQKSWWKVQA